jgi:hypothetical protein
VATILIGRRLNRLTDSVTAAQGQAGGQAWLTAEQNQLVPTHYDHLTITYVVGKPDLVHTVTYRTGGSGGIVVATLTLTYDVNDNLASVART